MEWNELHPIFEEQSEMNVIKSLNAFHDELLHWSVDDIVPVRIHSTQKNLFHQIRIVIDPQMMKEDQSFCI
jgi:hypothetical protein